MTFLQSQGSQHAWAWPSAQVISALCVDMCGAMKGKQELMDLFCFVLFLTHNSTLSPREKHIEENNFLL